MSAARALTPAEQKRRDLFVSACRVLLVHPDALQAELLDRAVIADATDWRRLHDNPLAWAAAQRGAAGEPARRFDAFWLLVEEQHALQAAGAAATP